MGPRDRRGRSPARGSEVHPRVRSRRRRLRGVSACETSQLRLHHPGLSTESQGPPSAASPQRRGSSQRSAVSQIGGPLPLFTPTGWPSAPWVRPPPPATNPDGVPHYTGSRAGGCTAPSGLVAPRTFPGCAPASRPWAMMDNPLGIQTGSRPSKICSACAHSGSESYGGRSQVLADLEQFQNRCAVNRQRLSSYISVPIFLSSFGPG